MSRRTRKQNFWKEVEYAIRRNIVRDNADRFIPSWDQTGGAFITVNNNTFKYYEDESKTQVLIVGGKTKGNADCFRLTIDKAGPQITAQLEEVMKGKNCSIEGTATSKDVVEAAIQIAVKHGAKGITLVDESGICREDGGRTIPLSLYYFLTRGQTWYETIRPFRPVRQSQIDEARVTVIQNSWADVLRGMTKKYAITIQKEFPADISDIDIHAPGSAMRVLQKIPYNVRCSFYRKYMDELVHGSHISIVKGSMWYLPLSADYIPPSEDIFMVNGSVGVEREDY